MYLKPLSFIVILLIIFKKVECGICEFSTCGECISFAQELCVWCAKDDFKGRRCLPKVNVNYTWCEPKYLMNPLPTMKFTKTKDFNETRDSIVQLKPQAIEMNARPGIPLSFNVSYKPAKDFPLDVYYIMDVSYSMRNKFQDLKKQAKSIYSELFNYTNNVRLGVGSFIEKRGFPFFDVNRHQGETFRNVVPLTYDMHEFDRTISNVKFGSNFDDPEAGLDALMQAITCEKEIGWRPGARRIIVLSTDSTYHSAGDGKIVGAYKPHDMKCHLINNTYTEALTFDYPSVSQINKVAMLGKFRIIFAIAKHSQTQYIPEAEYKALANQISGAKFARLEGGSSVIQIIKEAYEEMTSTVVLQSNAPNSVELTFDQDCQSKPTRNCVITHTSPVVTIPTTLTLKSCPNEKQLTITVFPIGLDEKLTIDMRIICQCECETSIGVRPEKCNHAGMVKCGVCHCDPGSYGANCQCTGSSTLQRDMEKCVQNGSGVFCSGKGECVCGKCENCMPGYSGDYCEFDDNSCPRPGGALCFNKGNCTRGSCNCEAGWTGEDCHCSLTRETCFAPNSKEECSGNGKCICGKCECKNAQTNQNETTYTGVFCDACEECAEKRCKELEDYVYCNYEHMDNKTYCDQQNDVTAKDIIVYFVNKTEINSPKWYMAVWCSKVLENGTYIIFKYQYEDHQLILVIQKELEVQPEANLWIAAGIAIGSVLLIGLLTVIIWKVLVDIHDKREYQKFAKEAEAAGYDVSLNPLYQAPAINFQNPAYDCN